MANGPDLGSGELVARRYIVGASLASGRHHRLHVATDRVLGRTVAIKWLKQASRSPEAARNLYREAIVGASLLHPNVCTVLDAGTLDDGRPFLVTEPLDGVLAASQRPQTAQMEAIAVIDIAVQTLAGLAAAHGAGTVHGGVRPTNVLLVETERGGRPLVKVLGLGQTPDAPPDDYTDGTCHYLAPEQVVDDAGAVDQRVDVYGVGLIAYELLARARAFTGTNRSDVVRRIVAGELASLRTVRPDVPASLAKAIARAMSIDLGFRFATARDFLAALVVIHEGLTSRPYVPPWALVAAPAYVDFGDRVVLTGSGEPVHDAL